MDAWTDDGRNREGVTSSSSYIDFVLRRNLFEAATCTKLNLVSEINSPLDFSVSLYIYCSIFGGPSPQPIYQIIQIDPSLFIPHKPRIMASVESSGIIRFLNRSWTQLQKRCKFSWIQWLRIGKKSLWSKSRYCFSCGNFRGALSTGNYCRK